MNKPLSETHPTIYSLSKVPSAHARYGSVMAIKTWIQKHTVDVAEHDALKQRLEASLDIAFEHSRELEAEVERLKKELETEYVKNAEELLDWNKSSWEQGFNKGVVEGERRAMNKVKEAIKKQYASTLEVEEFELSNEEYTARGVCKAIERELGLGSVGEEKDTGNGSYQNKGEKQ